MDVWRDLEPLRRNRHVHMEQVTYGVLWELCGGTPGEIVVTAKRLRRDVNRDEATIRAHLVRLYRLDIVELVDRDRQRGTYRLVVYRPLPAHATKRPDPQKLLPGFWQDGDSQTSSAAADLKPAGPKTPSPESVSTACQTGDVPLPGAGFFSPEGAGNSPRRGEFPAPSEGRNRAGNSPRGPTQAREIAAHIEGQPLPGGRENSAGNSPRRIPPRGPRARPSNESAASASLLNGLNEQHGVNELNEFKESFPPAGAGNSPRRGEFPAPAIGQLTAEIVGPRLPRERTKVGLVAELRRLVADPFTGDWLFGYAADLMLVHGSSSHPRGGDIYAAMAALIRELKDLRETEARKGQKSAPRGKRLNAVVMATAKKFGIPTPTQRREAKAAAATASISATTRRTAK